MTQPEATRLRKEQHKQRKQHKDPHKARKEAEADNKSANSSPEDLQCKECRRRFKDRPKYAIHVAWCENDHKCAQCPEDNTKYATDRALHRHWNAQHKFLGCSFCEAKPFSQDREKHEREHHPKEFQARDYRRQHHHELQSCSFCGLRLFPPNLEKHERHSHPEGFEARETRREQQQRLQKCRFCKAKLLPKERAMHERESHRGEFENRQWEEQYAESEPEPKASQTSEELPRAPNHYTILGVARDASEKELQLAARRMRILCHPDKLKRDGQTPEQVAIIDEIAKNVGWAADILCDETSRRKYDRELDGLRE